MTERPQDLSDLHLGKDCAPLLNKWEEELFKPIPTVTEEFPKLSIGSFEKFRMPIIRSPMAAIKISDIVDVQPMTEAMDERTPLQEFTERVWADEDPTDDE